MNDSKFNNTIKWIRDKRTIYLNVCRACGATNPHDVLYKCSNCNRGVEQFYMGDDGSATMYVDMVN